MEKVFEKLDTLSTTKVHMWTTSFRSAVSYALLGGLFIGIGMLIYIGIGVYTYENVPEMTRLLQALTFGIALNLTLFAGAELYTSNNFILTASAIRQHISWRFVLLLCAGSWLFNFIGAQLLAFGMYYSGLFTDAWASYIAYITAIKLAPSFTELFIRGILCNLFVCLAVWCFYKIEQDIAKWAMVFCCIFPFIFLGFEHSVANMTLFAVAAQLDITTYIAMLHNLVPVTLGNFVGGALLAVLYTLVNKGLPR